ncbi:MAG: V-type ATP synthase subunit I [Christensenellales bacterium]
MIAEMKKLYLLGHNSQKSKILKALYRSKTVEVVETEDIADLNANGELLNLDVVNEKLSRLSNAINFMDAEKREGVKVAKLTEKSADKFEYKPIKVKLSESTPRMVYDEFAGYAEREYEIFGAVSTLERINSHYAEIAGETAKLLSVKSQIECFKSIEQKLDMFSDTKFTSVFYGYVPVEKKEETEKLLSEIDFPLVYEIYSGDRVIPVAFLCLKENSDDLTQRLQAVEFNRSTLLYSKTAAEKLDEIDARLGELEKDKRQALAESLENEKYLRDFKILYDYYLVEKAKIDAEGNFKCTDSVFVLKAWYPIDREEKLKSILDIVCDEMVYELREATEEDDVPTLVRNNKIVSPFQSINTMFSPMNYWSDFDSNPIMTFFYFLFFGIMIADAGYGLLLAIGGLIMLKVTKPVPGKGRLVMIVTLGGVSTIIWGIIFGGWFGIDLNLLGIESEFLSGLIGLSLFQPLSEPLIMLGLCLGLGVLQIVVAMILNTYNLFRKAYKYGKNNKQRRSEYIVEAFSSSITWLMIMFGIGFVVLALLFKVMPCLYVGIVLIALGVVGILVCSAIKKKSALGLITGIAKLYDGVNIVSDILSYARLFGLGLAGGVVAMVVNMLASVIIGMIPIPAIGVIVAIPILIIGHVFNLFISGLGAYVHDCRLQFIEFYGKFYEGGGRLFVPLGSNTKYTYIDM